MLEGVHDVVVLRGGEAPFTTTGIESGAGMGGGLFEVTVDGVMPSKVEF